MKPVEGSARDDDPGDLPATVSFVLLGRRALTGRTYR
jgi:hypothetical protein